MSLLKQINDKGAVIEWSPIASNANMVALGTKVGINERNWMFLRRINSILHAMLSPIQQEREGEMTVTWMDTSDLPADYEFPSPVCKLLGFSFQQLAASGSHG